MGEGSSILSVVPRGKQHPVCSAQREAASCLQCPEESSILSVVPKGTQNLLSVVPRGKQNFLSVDSPEEKIKHPYCEEPTGKQNFLFVESPQEKNKTWRRGG